MAVAPVVAFARRGGVWRYRIPTSAEFFVTQMAHDHHRAEVERAEESMTHSQMYRLCKYRFFEQ
jgi:hypothetical protein